MPLPKENKTYTYGDYITWPEDKRIELIDGNKRYGRPDIYTDEDKIKVSIFNDLIIDLKAVFQE